MTDQVVIQQIGLNEVEVQQVGLSTVEIQHVGSKVVEVQPSDQPIVELALTNIGIRGPQGPQGLPGPSGSNDIGGLPVLITSPQEKDILQLQSSAWRNTAQDNLTDGGNF